MNITTNKFFLAKKKKRFGLRKPGMLRLLPFEPGLNPAQI
jgi:hypothetical protein